MESTGTTLFHHMILAKRVLLFEAKELLHADATMLRKSYQRFMKLYLYQQIFRLIAFSPTPPFSTTLRHIKVCRPGESH